MLRYLSLFLVMLLIPATAAGAEVEDDTLLTLREALILGVERNLDLRITAQQIAISADEVTAEEAAFDPAVTAGADASAERTPTSSIFTGDKFDRQRTYAGSAALNKRFRTGLEGELAFETSRQTTNSSVIGLNPQYLSFLVLDLTQPLLRDFGIDVNTTDLRTAEQRRRQASLGFLDRARLLGNQIERAYVEIVRSYEVLEQRIDSRNLARELLGGNRKKFDAGLIPISEVQEAETAVASRDEQVLFARQQAEVAVNNLQDLLETDGGGMLDEPIRTTGFSVAGSLVPERDNALALALDNRPDLEDQRVELAVRDIRVNFARNQKLPRLDLEGTLGTNGLSGEAQTPTFTTGPTEPNPFRGEYSDSLEGMSERDGYEWAVGVNFSYPLGNREAEARLRQTRLQKKQEIYRLRRVENGIITEVDNALVAVNRSLERVAVAERFVDLAETTLHQEMERLRAGLSDTFRILDFQDDVIEAQIRKVNALADVDAGLADLYAAMGMNLERHGILPALVMGDK